MPEIPVQPDTPVALPAHETERTPRIERPTLRSNADVSSAIVQILGHIDAGLRMLGVRLRQVGRDNLSLRTRAARVIVEPGPPNRNVDAMIRPVPLPIAERSPDDPASFVLPPVPQPIAIPTDRPNLIRPVPLPTPIRAEVGGDPRYWRNDVPSNDRREVGDGDPVHSRNDLPSNDRREGGDGDPLFWRS